MRKGVCSLSLDLDNQWSYMKTHGDRGWEDFPSYLDLVVPRFLKILDGFGWTITVFVVGQDAALDRNHDALQMISEAGHEIGNHSFHHQPWLHLYSEQQIEEEISRAEDVIEAATQIRPSGFRGPGYSLSAATLEVLHRRNYRFDASTFPTYLGPLARAYYFMTSNFSAEEKDRRKVLFGRLGDGLRPVKPYLWKLGAGELLEIPVSTMPIAKIPFHFSYLLYLATFSQALATTYLRFALHMCRMTGTQPSLLLHPLDFLGGDDVSELSFFPAMQMGGKNKVDLLERFLRMIDDHFIVIPVGAHAARLSTSDALPRRTPERFQTGAM